MKTYRVTYESPASDRTNVWIVTADNKGQVKTLLGVGTKILFPELLTITEIDYSDVILGTEI